ncbi:hypothetical protein [Pseudomonas viridiflava]|uniref:hypothetical protein n=1 Tax=Pseudomonas viridiflava TaxID=33069 RepID=UPI0013E0146C|nr:hypothetical protein [Pseudomonas viridiflava]
MIAVQVFGHGFHVATRKTDTFSDQVLGNLRKPNVFNSIGRLLPFTKVGTRPILLKKSDVVFTAEKHAHEI